MHRRRLSAVHDFAALLRDVAEARRAPASMAYRDPGVDTAQGLLDEIEADFDRSRTWRAAVYPVVRRLGALGPRRRVPAAPFRRLITAAREDQAGRRNSTMDDFLCYCQWSGGSLGELTLVACRSTVDDELAHAVGDIFTAARMLVVCGRVRPDAERGRVRLPSQSLGALGVRDDELTADAPRRAAREAVALAAHQATLLLRSAAPLVASLPLLARVAVAGVVAESTVLADELERAGFFLPESELKLRRGRRWRAFAAALRPV
jgi:phytoene/squalene synthetase